MYYWHIYSRAKNLMARLELQGVDVTADRAALDSSHAELMSLLRGLAYADTLLRQIWKTPVELGFVTEKELNDTDTSVLDIQYPPAAFTVPDYVLQPILFRVDDILYRIRLAAGANNDA